MLDLPPHQWSRLIGLQPIKHPTKWVARPFSRQRPPGFRSLDPTAGTIPNPRRRPHQRTFGRDCVKPSPIRIFAITRVRDSRNLSTSWPPSCRFCLVPAPRNQCKTARGREKTSRPETTAMRHFISARASSTPASVLGGMAAKTFPWAKLKIAEAMEKAGKSVDEIWRATGLERGADKFWRFEISDRGYRVKPNVGVLDNEGFRVAPLYEQQVHPGMQAAYPNLAGAQSKIRIDPRGPELGVFQPGSIAVEAPIRSVTKSKSIHELQHMIDHLEGHARGGHPLEFMRPGISWQEAHELYRRLAGEVAARNAKSRLYESELQRQRKSPLRTEDIPRDQQIVRFSPRDQ